MYKFNIKSARTTNASIISKTENTSCSYILKRFLIVQAMFATITLNVVEVTSLKQKQLINIDIEDLNCAWQYVCRKRRPIKL